MFPRTTPTYPLVRDPPHQASFQTNYPWAKMAYETLQHDSAQMMTSWPYPAPCVVLVIGSTKIQPTVQQNLGKANFVQTLLRKNSTNLLKYSYKYAFDCITSFSSALYRRNGCYFFDSINILLNKTIWLIFSVNKPLIFNSIPSYSL